MPRFPVSLVQRSAVSVTTFLPVSRPHAANPEPTSKTRSLRLAYGDDEAGCGLFIHSRAPLHSSVTRITR